MPATMTSNIAQDSAKIVQNVDIPWGTIAIACSVAFVSVLYTYLASKGLAPAIGGKVAGQEFQVGKDGKAGSSNLPSSCMKHEEIDNMVDGLFRSKRHMEYKIKGRQLRSIQESSDDFDDFTDGWPEVLADSMWLQFDRTLLVAVIENHIIYQLERSSNNQIVYPLRLKEEYLQDKYLSLATAYRRKTKKHETLPQWQAIQTRAELLVRVALDRFAAIAVEEWDGFSAHAQSVVLAIGDQHPAVTNRIKRLLEED